MIKYTKRILFTTQKYEKPTSLEILCERMSNKNIKKKSRIRKYVPV